MKKGSEVIGHILRKISAACFNFLDMGGTATCEITDSHHQYLPQGGLEIPCKLIFKSRDVVLMMKIKRLVRVVPPIELECKQTVPLKRKLDPESFQKPSSKKKASKNQAKLSFIDLDSESTAAPSDRNVAKGALWVNFSRHTLTTVDKSIILTGIFASYVNNLFCICR